MIVGHGWGRSTKQWDVRFSPLAEKELQQHVLLGNGTSRLSLKDYMLCIDATIQCVSIPIICF